jgi:hypothetical protein
MRVLLAKENGGDTLEHTIFLQKRILEDKPYFLRDHKTLPDLIQKYPIY